MPDIASISTAITAVKTAINITKIINDIDREFEKSELKQIIIELRGALIEASDELFDAKQIIYEKDAEINKLRSSIEEKEAVRQGKKESKNFLKKNRTIVLKILFELENARYRGLYEHVIWDSLCDELSKDEMIIKVILDYLIDEEFFNFKIGEHSFRQILGTTPKARRFMLMAKKTS